MAHGILGLAIATGLISHAPRVDTMAFLAILEWRFLLPIVFGDTIKVISRIEALEPQARGRRGIVTWHRHILNQNDAGRSRRPQPDLGAGKASIAANQESTRRTPRKLEDRHHGTLPYQSYRSRPALINAFLSVDEPFLIAVCSACGADRDDRTAAVRPYCVTLQHMLRRDFVRELATMSCHPRR